jgi:hypothetical protein
MIGYGAESVRLAKDNSKIYLHQKWQQIPKKAEEKDGNF